MSGKRITPDVRFVKFVKGQRYMINVATAGKHGAPVYPYSKAMMDQNHDLVEIFPTYPDDEAAVAPVTLCDDDIALTEPVVIDDVVVKNDAPPITAVPEENKMTPIEKARAAKKAKNETQTKE